MRNRLAIQRPGLGEGVTFESRTPGAERHVRIFTSRYLRKRRKSEPANQLRRHAVTTRLDPAIAAERLRRRAFLAAEGLSLQ